VSEEGPTRSASSSISLTEPGVRLVGVEAGGRGLGRGDHAARFEGGRLGVLQGSKTYILQNPDGQIELTHSVSAGLDYAAIGPEHAYYRDQGRIEYAYACDDEVIKTFQLVSRLEGISARARVDACSGPWFETGQ
jgi:tryptophan synthase beta chain